MNTERFQLEQIPSVLYGAPGERGFLFLHGQMGYKEEAKTFAQAACPKGYQVLSIDLPGHGERQGREEQMAPWTAVPDIRAALTWAKSRWESVSLRANSLGAYFARLAFDRPEQVLLVSPILDMEGLILTMMDWAGVTEEELRKRGEIAATFGQSLSWKYLCWVRAHPAFDWTCPTHILYGSRDNMTSRQTIEEYIRRHDVRLTVMKGGEHWFHTPDQMTFLQAWEDAALD